MTLVIGLEDLESDCCNVRKYDASLIANAREARLTRTSVFVIAVVVTVVVTRFVMVGTWSTKIFPLQNRLVASMRERR